MENFNIVSHFLEKAEIYPTKKAIIYQEKVITYGELKTQVLQTANYLLSKGIKKGDRVLVFVPMSMDLYRNVLALFHIGATAVFLDEWVSKSRMEMCCEIAQCKAFIAVSKIRILSFLSKELRKIPIKLSEKYHSFQEQFPIELTQKDDIALITFTTGSTGKPKAAKRTHGFLEAQFAALTDKIQPKENDVELTMLPIVLLINLGVGNTSVISDFKAKKPHQLKADEVIQKLQKYKVNRIIASPFFVKELAKYLKKTSHNLPDLKIIYTGGAPVFQSDAKFISSAFSEATLEIVYGSTEAEPISTIESFVLIKDLRNDEGLNVGFPYHGTEVRIIQISENAISCQHDSDLEQITLDKNQIGEIIVAGKHVLDSYYNNEEALFKNKIFIDKKCWHRTGDSGFLSESGELYLAGRCSALIQYEGKIISPFVCENKLKQIESIEIATLVEINHKLLIVVELKEKSLKSDDLKNQIHNLKIPHSAIIFKKIPRDPRHNSKIDYEKLKKLLNK
ncbi:MAG: AMP-binding protein [Flavobacteriia bacterium]